MKNLKFEKLEGELGYGKSNIWIYGDYQIERIRMTYKTGASVYWKIGLRDWLNSTEEEREEYRNTWHWTLEANCGTSKEAKEKLIKFYNEK